MIERYLEILCDKRIRLYLDTAPELETGWLHELTDPMVAQIIFTIHSQPAYD